MGFDVSPGGGDRKGLGFDVSPGGGDRKGLGFGASPRGLERKGLGFDVSPGGLARKGLGPLRGETKLVKLEGVVPPLARDLRPSPKSIAPVNASRRGVSGKAGPRENARRQADSACSDCCLLRARCSLERACSHFASTFFRNPNRFTYCSPLGLASFDIFMARTIMAVRERCADLSTTLLAPNHASEPGVPLTTIGQSLNDEDSTNNIVLASVLDEVDRPSIRYSDGGALSSR